MPGIVGQGFPECFYPDETNAIQRALKFGAEKTADPGWFNKPALAYYLWFAEYGAFYVGGRVVGHVRNARAVRGLGLQPHRPVPPARPPASRRSSDSRPSG